MPYKRRPLASICKIALGTLFLALGCLCSASPTSADLPLLTEHITAYNLEQHKNSLSDHSYRGEEGILRIKPEVGRSFGLNVLLNQDYIKATELYGEAKDLFKKAVEAMTTREGEQHPGEHVNKVAEMAVQHNQTIALAWEHMISYRSKLTAEVDDRLNADISSRLMEKLLMEDMEKAAYNLRDTLGSFHNQCEELDEDAPLNLENIKFVNYVFHEFTENASEEAKNRFDLDISNRKDDADSGSVWKIALGKSSSRFSSVLEAVFEKHQKTGYPVDELLFLALIWQESDYDPRNVSYVGAAGLTQIMPSTAKGLGMKNIFAPPYFKEAGSLLGHERRLKHKAKNLLREMTEENSLVHAKQARNLTQESLDCRKKRKELFARYRQKLLEDGTDDRLNPHKALEFGLKYFSQMMKIQKGDTSLALASYNAGPHRVKQYNGIPPFEETINFRNRVLNYYRFYQSRVKKYLSEQAATR
ncbi:MAG: lytic transglycosylase domain-containing protein [Deltaproteobacteria bacterium]|nr:lytic transglycosylase domain-containing protein [Deltaproteobacteria bacterium]